MEYLGYWIEETETGVELYAGTDEWSYPNPIKEFPSVYAAISWIEIGTY